MAQDPVIAYYPPGTTKLKKISLSFVSDLQPVDQVEAVDVRAGGASPYRHTYGRTRSVLIVKERFTSASLRRDLEALIAHLRAGGVCQFVLTLADGVAVFANPPEPGDTTLSTIGSNIMAPLDGSAVLASGDELRIESPERQLRTESVTFSSESGNVYTVSDIRNDYPVGPVLVRERDTYPVLRLPAELANSTDLLTHDRRLNYTLALPLVEYPSDLFALYEAAELGGLTDGALSTHFDSLDTLLNRQGASRFAEQRPNVLDRIGRGSGDQYSVDSIRGVSASGLQRYRTDPRWLR